MKLTLVVLIFFGAGTSGYGQLVGTIFPNISTENIHDKTIALPAHSKGKFTLIGMAYSKKAEEELNTWFNPIYSTFIEKPTGIFKDFGYDVNIYFIPMFTGTNTAVAGAAKKKVIKNIDPKLLPYVLFYKGKLEPYKSTLDFEQRDTPYFFVLDKNGSIIYATSGRYSAKKMREIEILLSEE